MHSEPRLVPLRPDEIGLLVRSGIEAYADELAASGMVRDAARAKAVADYHEAFPDGSPAPGHVAFALREGDALVGWIWLGPAAGEAPGSWWVNDVEVVETERGRGLGRTLMELAEIEVRDRGGTSLGLNVFGPNHIARQLYESLGYEPTSIRMRKEIDHPTERD